MHDSESFWPGSAFAFKSSSTTSLRLASTAMLNALDGSLFHGKLLLLLKFGIMGANADLDKQIPHTLSCLDADRPSLSSPALEVSALACSKCLTKAALPEIVAAKSGLCPSISQPFSGLAPALSRASAVFHDDIWMAALKAERPEESTAVGLAAAESKAEIAKVMRLSTATRIGARPLASRPWFGDAPNFRTFTSTSCGLDSASKTKDPPSLEGASVKLALARASSMINSTGHWSERTA